MAQKKKSFLQKNGLVAVWSAAGLVAAGYIAFLFLGAGPHGNGIGKLANTSAGSPTHTAAPEHEEVANLRAHVVELKDQEEHLAQKISKIEQTIETFGPITASIQSNKPSTGYGIDEEPRASSEPPSTAGGPNVAVKVSPLPQDENLAETYSSGGFDTYGLSLASARSVDALERHWDYLVKTAGATLAGLKPRYVRKGGADNPQFELVAGPLDRMSDAQSRCEQLSRINIDCQNTRYEQDLRGEFQSAAHGSSEN
jgi:hypothetical protein